MADGRRHRDRAYARLVRFLDRAGPSGRPLRAPTQLAAPSWRTPLPVGLAPSWRWDLRRPGVNVDDAAAAKKSRPFLDAPGCRRRTRRAGGASIRRLITTRRREGSA